MNLASLITNLERLGIRLEAEGDRLRYFPRSALTPDLLDGLKAHKAELLPMLWSAAELGTCEYCGEALTETPTIDGFLNLECLGCDRCFGCRPSSAEIAARFAETRNKAISVVNEESEVTGEQVVPCPECGSLELWQSAAGDLFGHMPGIWRCMKCDPPTTARRLAEAAENIRRQTNPGNDTRQKG